MKNLKYDLSLFSNDIMNYESFVMLQCIETSLALISSCSANMLDITIQCVYESVIPSEPRVRENRFNILLNT